MSMGLRGVGTCNWGRVQAWAVSVRGPRAARFQHWGLHGRKVSKLAKSTRKSKRGREDLISGRKGGA